MMTLTPVKRALISVSNKTGLVEFAAALKNLNIEIVSTGGTSKTLQHANIPHRQVDEITGLPEMLNGRVKTLHPRIHGGILGRRDQHAQEATEHAIEWIDLVVVNFYPFAEATQQKTLTWDEAVEHIDVGGPTMVRAAAKNFAWVGVVVDPTDYSVILKELQSLHGLQFSTRKTLAEKAFQLTFSYDAMIHRYFSTQNEATEKQPRHLQLQMQQVMELRYGENPHQKAYAYQLQSDVAGVLNAKQHQGKALSYNNILDAEAAFNCVNEFNDPACVIVKHANPCGVATAASIEEAYLAAFNADSLSAFGGIIALNTPCNRAIAELVANIFMEVLIAPAYSKEALAVLASKQNLRVLEWQMTQRSPWEMKFISGGVLIQEKDLQTLQANELKMVTKVQPTTADLTQLDFAWRVVKHIKSNAILIAKNNVTLGIGAGQVSRIDAVMIALRKAGAETSGAVLASDAFFPFRDSIDLLANSGIRAIIQPGGSVRDEEVIKACDEHGIAMVLSGKRCFKH